jgi:RNA recognition motif-containing protein
MEIFINNLAENVEEDDLVTLFAPYGEVRLVEFNYDLINKYYVGSAVILLKTSSAIEDIIANINNTEIYGKKIKIKENLPKAEKRSKNKEKNVYESEENLDKKSERYKRKKIKTNISYSDYNDYDDYDDYDDYENNGDYKKYKDYDDYDYLN